MVASLMLFSMSGVYHLFNWGPKVKGILRRFDHMNIFLIIAGTYTPLAVSCLPLDPELLINGDIAWYSSGFVLLVGIWVLALLGLLVHVIWIGAPRVLYVVIYIVLGAGALIFLPAIAVSGIRFAVAVVSLIGAGGACYIIGAIFYAIKNPLRNARVFGFHELFHCHTLAAFSCHTVAIYLAALG
jgi:hemolysin III